MKASPARGKRSGVNIAERYEEIVPLPRAIKFPVELVPPEGFDVERIETWPKISGRLEYVAGRLLYMPPCGEQLQETLADIVGLLAAWVRSHPRLFCGDKRGRDAPRR